MCVYMYIYIYIHTHIEWLGRIADMAGIKGALPGQYRRGTLWLTTFNTGYERNVHLGRNNSPSP